MKKRWFLWSCLVLLVAGVVCIVRLHIRYPLPFAFPLHDRPVLIAHAGGAIDGLTGTNAYEAVQQAIANGFSFIELDLWQTVDGGIVATHDPEKFYAHTGLKPDDPSGIRLDKKKKPLLHNKYSLIVDDDINDIFSGPGSPWLVTDKINIWPLLEKITVSKDKMLVEVFSYERYRRALQNGIKYPMLHIRDKEMLEDCGRLLRFGRIKIITVSTELLQEAMQDIEALYTAGITVFVFTVNDVDFINSHINKVFTGVYTDFVTCDLLGHFSFEKL